MHETRQMKAKNKPKLGQNFLIDQAAQRNIVAALGPAVSGRVLEIGPGKAAITELLVARAAHLTVVELDGTLAAALRQRFGGTLDIVPDVVQADILRVDLTALVPLSLQPARSLAVIGNLPYYITSPILQHLFLHQQVLSRAVLMVQREVAERMTAGPGSRDYGLLSVLCQMHAQCELLFTLPPAAFDPPPEVHSSVVRLEFAPRWLELGVEPAPFARFLGQCFAQKRKTLGNNLRAAGYSGAAVETACAVANLQALVRAEALSAEALAAVFRALGPVSLEPAAL